MKLPSMSARDRRTVTIGAAILVPSLLFVYGVQPYRRALDEFHRETAQQRTLLAHDRSLVARLPTIPATATAVSQQLDRETARLFDAEDDLAATGRVQEYVTSIASTTGVQIQHAETRPSLSLVPGVHVLQLAVHVEGDLDGILHFLRQLEAGNKLIRIDPLIVERMQGEGNAQKPDTLEVLSLSATIYGYRLTQDTTPSSDADAKASGAPSLFTRVAYELPAIDAVVDHDPFAPTRARPSMSYRTVVLGGGEGTGKRGASQSKRQPCTLVGTVIPVPGPGFAICQNGGEVPRIVHVGSSIAGYRLIALRRGRAVFATQDGKQIELQTPHPGSPQ